MNLLARPFTLFSVLLIFVGLASTATPASEEPPVVRALLDSVALEAAARPTYRSLDVAPDGTITLSGLEVTLQPTMISIRNELRGRNAHAGRRDGDQPRPVRDR
jgi:hypothetical protein